MPGLLVAPRGIEGEHLRLRVDVRRRGLEPRVFIAPDEGHGFVKLDNRIYFYERCAAFLEETIGGRAPAATSLSLPSGP